MGEESEDRKMWNEFLISAVKSNSSQACANDSFSSYLLAGVGLLIELLEQEEEHDGMHSDPPDEGLRVVAIDEEKLESVQHDENELYLQTVSISVYVTFRPSKRCFIVSPFGGP